MTVNSERADQDERTESFRQAVMHELMRQSRVAEMTRNLLLVLVAVVLVLIVLAILDTQI